MDTQYDDFFAGFPAVQFASCLNFQDIANERPFYPPEAESALGAKYRKQIPYAQYNAETSADSSNYKMAGNEVDQGGWEQRNVTIQQVMRVARKLTDWELEGVNAVKRWAGDYLPA